jgi:hypothetical protein
MLATMLQDFVCELEAQVEQWAQELWRTPGLAKLEMKEAVEVQLISYCFDCNLTLPY